MRNELTNDLIAAEAAMKAAEHTWVKSWDSKDMYNSAEYHAFEAKQIAYENLLEESGHYA